MHNTKRFGLWLVAFLTILTVGLVAVVAPAAAATQYQATYQDFGQYYEATAVVSFDAAVGREKVVFSAYLGAYYSGEVQTRLYGAGYVSATYSTGYGSGPRRTLAVTHYCAPGESFVLETWIRFGLVRMTSVHHHLAVPCGVGGGSSGSW